MNKLNNCDFFVSPGKTCGPPCLSLRCWATLNSSAAFFTGSGICFGTRCIIYLKLIHLNLSTKTILLVVTQPLFFFVSFEGVVAERSTSARPRCVRSPPARFQRVPWCSGSAGPTSSTWAGTSRRSSELGAGLHHSLQHDLLRQVKLQTSRSVEGIFFFWSLCWQSFLVGVQVVCGSCVLWDVQTGVNAAGTTAGFHPQ